MVFLQQWHTSFPLILWSSVFTCKIRIILTHLFILTKIILYNVTILIVRLPRMSMELITDTNFTDELVQFDLIPFLLEL